jgi:hypothetical protein
MAIVNTETKGFYAGRIGTTENDLPVYLYFEPSSNQFRPVIVPPIGNPYYAPPRSVIHHDADRIPLLTSTVVLGAIGAILGGGPGAVAGAALGAVLSKLSGRHSQTNMV